MLYDARIRSWYDGNFTYDEFNYVHYDPNGSVAVVTDDWPEVVEYYTSDLFGSQCVPVTSAHNYLARDGVRYRPSPNVYQTSTGGAYDPVRGGVTASTFISPDRDEWICYKTMKGPVYKIGGIPMIWEIKIYYMYYVKLPKNLNPPNPSMFSGDMTVRTGYMQFICHKDMSDGEGMQEEASLAPKLWEENYIIGKKMQQYPFGDAYYYMTDDPYYGIPPWDNRKPTNNGKQTLQP